MINVHTCRCKLQTVSNQQTPSPSFQPWANSKLRTASILLIKDCLSGFRSAHLALPRSRPAVHEWWQSPCNNRMPRCWQSWLPPTAIAPICVPLWDGQNLDRSMYNPAENIQKGNDHDLQWSLFAKGNATVTREWASSSKFHRGPWVSFNFKAFNPSSREPSMIGQLPISTVTNATVAESWLVSKASTRTVSNEHPRDKKKLTACSR